MRENCLAEFEKHWNCLEWNNQVKPNTFLRIPLHSHNVVKTQEYQYCRKPERALNKCMFEKLVRYILSFVLMQWLE
jgi:NADH dehydrogenase (ubiquinone) 1 alpha subcomplex subunit 8